MGEELSFKSVPQASRSKTKENLKKLSQSNDNNYFERAFLTKSQLDASR